MPNTAQLNTRVTPTVKAALESEALRIKHERNLGRYSVGDLINERYERLLNLVESKEQA